MDHSNVARNREMKTQYTFQPNNEIRLIFNTISAVIWINQWTDHWSDLC